MLEVQSCHSVLPSLMLIQQAHHPWT
jgi:hypothetical protein